MVLQFALGVRTSFRVRFSGLLKLRFNNWYQEPRFVVVSGDRLLVRESKKKGFGFYFFLELQVCDAKKTKLLGFF